MSQGKQFSIDARMVALFDQLAALNPKVGQMVAALNVSLSQAGEKIETREDFEVFVEQIEEWRD
ncbi:hypothetical protein [Vibrio sagamiensis]|uniref:Uncharacterized protein n=1 Tax=Vibrio sagamiensis NBRC 104589 TaxID=1219064 RepID=A0A511QJP5_9VIBR|nr:hypothetical protein [Vibrio sagamiensis]PNQ66314.1 hypothetical protein C1141_08720 [Vibrio agarivorans]GEM77548.1 hypothetical protein VSA01S_36600 [Vibrio sagamiensis NBRC 104589]